MVNAQHVSRIKPRLFGSNEESIGILQVASVHISTGILWSDIVIESAGGTDPITSHGHRKADAQRIRQLIENLSEGSADLMLNRFVTWIVDRVLASC